MAQCKLYWVCGRDEVDEDGFCILHSPNPEKDQEAFDVALAEHREKREGIFYHFVFPGPADFSEIKFPADANFIGATFVDKVDFAGAVFGGKASFGGSIFGAKVDFMVAEFHGKTHFRGARFRGEADFASAKFKEDASFGGAIFRVGTSFGYATFGAAANFSGVTVFGEADYADSTFSGKTDFGTARFGKGANFSDAAFGGQTQFRSARFRGRMLFCTWEGAGKIFSGAAVDFRDIILDPLDGLIIRDADLSRCRFLGTDLRNAEITNATWTKIGDRVGVYDEVAPLRGNEKRPWAHIERLYRELKQNYEERRDYERAGDFHYGEKEMRRRNPETSWGLWLFLSAYWLVSGYGERYLRPLICLGALWAGSTLGYLCGLGEKGDPSVLLGWSPWDQVRAALYTLQVMTHVKPDDLVPIGLFAQLIHTADSILGPLLIGLFALALRQRLKR